MFSLKLISPHFHNKLLEMNHKLIFPRSKDVHRQILSLDCTVLLGCRSGHMYRVIARLFCHSLFFQTGGICCRSDKPGSLTRCRLYRGFFFFITKNPKTLLKPFQCSAQSAGLHEASVFYNLHKTKVLLQSESVFCPALTIKGNICYFLLCFHP